MSESQPPSSGLARFRAKLSERTSESTRSPEAQAIHERVDQLVELEIRDVMTPRTDVAYLVTPVTPEAVAEAVRDTGHSGIPVVNDDLDDVIGVLFVNDLFRSSTLKRAIGVSLPSTEEIARKVRKPLMLPETMDLLEALGEMRSQRRTFGLALDEHGGVAGVVSIRDILEQLVGDLNDEFDEDEDPTIVPIRKDRWLVDGQTHVDEVSETIGVQIPEGDYVTIAGYLLFLFHALPAAGATQVVDGWSFRAQSIDKQRISEVVIERLPEESEPEDAVS